MALEISLAQFNKIATGDYNAGQIDIRTSKGGQAELVKVNNHVWQTSKNKVVLSPERILEVKELFVNALRAGGVSPAKLAEIREQLGIPSDLAASLNTDENKRAEVTEILDDMVEGILRTSGQLSGEVSQRMGNEIMIDPADLV